MCLHLIESHTGRGNVALVNQSCLTADIWLRAECGNTIPDRSTGEPNQLRDTREWLKGGSRVAQGGSIYTRHIRNTKGQRSA